MSFRAPLAPRSRFKIGLGSLKAHRGTATFLTLNILYHVFDRRELGRSAWPIVWQNCRMKKTSRSVVDRIGNSSDDSVPSELADPRFAWLSTRVSQLKKLHLGRSRGHCRSRTASSG